MMVAMKDSGCGLMELRLTLPTLPLDNLTTIRLYHGNAEKSSASFHCVLHGECTSFIMAMLRSLLLLFIVFSMGNAQVNLSRKCPYGWINFGVRCFKFFSSTVHWVTAEKNCQSLGANLASIHSKIEQEFLLSLLPSSSTRCWIGTHDGNHEGQWLWTDGTPYDFAYFGPGQPDNLGEENCGELNFTDSEGNQLKTKKNCQSLGANLASVHSIIEHDFLLSLLPSSSTRCWIGIHDGNHEGQWLWTDGTPYDLAYFGPGQPDNLDEENCGELNLTANRWNDADCLTSLPYLCVQNL
ncbi:galactose-specific lectin nattectin-like protein [Labeo rohita]|uniref:Galactose-specific lectin nattectin-like protein n=1 Tax=Labeo rohita TaxID=84645 RepID=A0A498NEK4_LABRO|nr:galactose-specific lectin nattectin-like protein [Labeo rohita]